MTADPSKLDPSRRASDIARLASEQLDVLIVGGGVTGAGAALDAATRGLTVGLVEAQDFASGSSSRSSKLIHGGLRYLEMLDFFLVRQALKERGLLLTTIAPHLVHPIPFIYPLKRRVVDRVYMGAGLALYDLLSLSTRSSRGVPLHRHLSRRRSLELAPALRADALAGAIEYFDAQVDDARFVISLIRTAVSIGATAVNRLQVTGVLRDDTRVCGVVARDLELGSIIEIRARTVVFATGAWTEVIDGIRGGDGAPRVRPSKGVHLLVSRERIRSSVALVLRTKQSVLFVLPWGDHWMIGTTDTDWEYEKARPIATAADIDYLLATANTILASPLSRSDVISTFAGLRPLAVGSKGHRGRRLGRGNTDSNLEANESTAKLSREHVVERPEPGLVAISGGKFTTYRVMAADAIDSAVDDGGLTATPSRTEHTALVGAQGFRALVADQQLLSDSYGVPLASVQHLIARYGSLAHELLALIEAEPRLGNVVGGVTPYLGCEVVYAVSSEGARHLEDVLERRTRLAVESPDAGIGVAASVAALMAPLLGWTDETVELEMERYKLYVDLKQRSATSARTDQEAAYLLESLPPSLPLP